MKKSALFAGRILMSMDIVRVAVLMFLTDSQFRVTGILNYSRFLSRAA